MKYYARRNSTTGVWFCVCGFWDEGEFAVRKHLLEEHGSEESYVRRYSQRTVEAQMVLRNPKEDAP